MTRAPHHRKTKEPASAIGAAADRRYGPDAGRPSGVRSAAPTADPEEYRLPHPSDNAAYAQIDALNAAHKLNPLPFPAPRGLPEPRLTLAQVFGPNGDAIAKQIEASGRLVFHAVGDTGSVKGPETAGPRRRQDGHRLRRRGRREPAASSSFTSATSSITSASASITMTSFTSLIAITPRRSSRSPATTTAWSLRA